jgi:uncharacterized membrane protein
MRAFIAFVAVIAGALLVAENANIANYMQSLPQSINDLASAILGILLLGGGITYFWTRSRFYKG